MPEEKQTTISQRILSWPVAGTIILFLLGTGVSFMTSAHIYIADLFFLGGFGLFLFKFLSWDLSKQHQKRKVVQRLTICISLVVLIGAVLGNHYLNHKLPETKTAKNPASTPTIEDKAQKPAKPPPTASSDATIKKQLPAALPSPQTEAQPEQGYILGPRFEFGGLKVEHNNGYSVPVIQVHNTSEIAVSSYQLIGSVFLSNFENNLENEDVNNIINTMEDAAKNVVLVPVDQVQITRGMGISLKLKQQFSDDDIASVNNGSKKMYVVMLAIYITPKTPKNRMWITELCARVTKPFNDFESCPSHNRYFFSDRSLNKID